MLVSALILGTTHFFKIPDRNKQGIFKNKTVVIFFPKDITVFEMNIYLNKKIVVFDLLGNEPRIPPDFFPAYFQERILYTYIYK